MYIALLLTKVEMMEPKDDVTRRMSVRLAILLEKLDGEEAKKSKTVPRGDYLEFVKLVSVSSTDLNRFI